jgi:hypothetical protein
MKKEWKNRRNQNFWENFRFEFILYINNGRLKDEGDNIICQRLFDIPGYNKEVLKSDEIRELMENIAGMNTVYGTPGIIPNHFKNKSKSYSWKTYNPYRLPELEDKTDDLFAYEDVFTFEIKVDKRSVAKRQFSGNWFQKEVRYSADIRKIIPEIIDEIQDYFSRDEYTTSYGGVDLKFKFAPYKFQTQ